MNISIKLTMATLLLVATGQVNAGIIAAVDFGATSLSDSPEITGDPVVGRHWTDATGLDKTTDSAVDLISTADGADTGWDIAVTTDFAGVKRSDDNAWQNGYIEAGALYPIEAGDDILYANGFGILTISNLDDSKTYNLSLSGFIEDTNANQEGVTFVTDYTVGGTTKQFDPWGNDGEAVGGQETVDFAAVSTDGNGNITIRVAESDLSGRVFGVIGTLEIEQVPEPATVGMLWRRNPSSMGAMF